jgi:hypothetical protein
MKYLTLILFALIAWLILGEFVFKDRSSEGLDTTASKWRDLGRRLHLTFGVLAALVVALMLVRLIIHSATRP